MKGLSKIDQFAEHLANGMSVRDAAAALGWQKNTGTKMLSRLRSKLGWQAQ